MSTANEERSPRRGTRGPHGVGVLGAMAIGIGGMVGGGIFAVLGTAVAAAGGATPVAFATAGAIALLTAHSYARLAAAHPSAGGTVAFLDRAFGVDLLTGSVNLLLWFGYLVTIALYATAFGSYASRLFADDPGATLRHTLASAAIVVPVLLNLASAELVSRAESVVVALKLTVLVVVAVAGARSVDATRLAPGEWPGVAQILAGAMVIFVAYEGFELIANAGEDARDPRRSLPRAMYGSVGFVVLLYVALSTVTVGSLSADRIAAAQEYALAAAAEPSLGRLGFHLVAGAALLSTLSAVNATIYGNGRLAYTLAKDGELPEVFERRVWDRPAGGVIATGLASLVLANVLDVRQIAVLASAGFLLVFTVVNLAALRLGPDLGASRALPALSALATLGALAVLLVHADDEGRGTRLLVLGSWAVCVVAEAVVRRVTGRTFALDRTRAHMEPSSR